MVILKDKCSCFLLRSLCEVNGFAQIPRNGFVATKNSRLCSLHFETDDIVADRTDSHKSRGLTRGELSRMHLKPNVVPHIRPNCPKYMSKETAPPRGKAATSESRIQNELREKERRESIRIESNRFDSLPELVTKMKGSLPEDVHIIDSESSVSFISFTFDVITKIKY